MDIFYPGDSRRDMLTQFLTTLSCHVTIHFSFPKNILTLHVGEILQDLLQFRTEEISLGQAVTSRPRQK